MKTSLIVALALVCGGLFGYGMTWQEFRNDGDPTRAFKGYGEFDEEKPVVVAGELQPRVELSTNQVNFGTYDQGTPQSAVFKIRNVGKSTLTIRKGLSSCACTIASLGDSADRVEIEPGDEVPIKLEIDGSVTPGPFAKTATFHSNDPLFETITLTLMGHVARTIAVKPEVVTFTRLSPDRAAEAHVRLATYGTKVFEITKHELLSESTAENFEIEIRPLTEEELAALQGKSGVDVTIRIKPGLPLGRVDQTLSLTTSLDAPSNVAVPIHGNVESDITIRGVGWDHKRSVMEIGFLPEGKGAERAVHLLVTGDHRQQTTFEVDRCDPAWLEVRFGETRHGGETSLTPVTVKVPADAKPINRRGGETSNYGHILIKTSNPKAPSLRIDVDFAIE